VTPATLEIAVPEGCRFVSLEELPSGREVPFEVGPGGALTCTLDQVQEVTMLLARYEDED
jgi:hypothetical protein